MEGTSGGNRIVRWRLTFLAVLVPLLLTVFVARLFQLQILEGQLYRDQAYENRIRTISIPSPRGVVYDRNGVLLVRNVPQFNVMITPALLPDSPAEVEAIYQRISALTGVPVDLPGEPAPGRKPGARGQRRRARPAGRRRGRGCGGLRRRLRRGCLGLGRLLAPAGDRAVLHLRAGLGLRVRRRGRGAHRLTAARARDP
jgi:hypothetical protein